MPTKKPTAARNKPSQTSRLAAAIDKIAQRLDALENRPTVAAPVDAVASRLDMSWDPTPDTVEIPCPKEGTLLWASDIHFPYQCAKTCDIVLQFAQYKKPKIGILGGDIFDFYSISDFDRDPARSEDRLQVEFDAGRPFIEEFCKHCDVVLFLTGNHEIRGYRMLTETPGMYGLRGLELKKLAELPKKVQVLPYLTLAKIGGLYAQHGTIANRNTAKSTYEKFGRPMIVGHDHGAKTHIHVDLLTQESHATMVAGTCSDPMKAAWAKHPRWTKSFVSADLWTDTSGRPCFNAHHRIPSGNTLGVDGKVFRA